MANLRLERLLLDDGGLGIVERQPCRLDHRLTAVRPMRAAPARAARTCARTHGTRIRARPRLRQRPARPGTSRAGAQRSVLS
jgi:hypothetical protein